jgi:hypothetical protein
LNEIIFWPKVLVLLFSESLLFFLQTFSFLYALDIFFRYKKDASSLQYKLEEKTYFISTVISVSIYVKFFIVLFFIYTIDSLSLVISGAMCASGVFNANNYGDIALILKIINIFFAFLWIDLHKKDEYTKDHRFLKLKVGLYLILYILFGYELYNEVMFLFNLEIFYPLSCCVAIFKEEPFLNLESVEYLYLFLLNLAIVLALLVLKKRYLLIVFSILFLVSSYYAIVYFFSSYIYMLPTHKCPFCILQSDYGYIGYFIYISLFFATYFALKSSIYNIKKAYFMSLICYIIYFVAISYGFLDYILVFKHFL